MQLPHACPGADAGACRPVIWPRWVSGADCGTAGFPLAHPDPQVPTPMSASDDSSDDGSYDEASDDESDDEADEDGQSSDSDADDAPPWVKYGFRFDEVGPTIEDVTVPDETREHFSEEARQTAHSTADSWSGFFAGVGEDGEEVPIADDAAGFAALNEHPDPDFDPLAVGEEDGDDVIVMHPSEFYLQELAGGKAACAHLDLEFSSSDSEGTVEPGGALIQTSTVLVVPREGHAP